MNSNTAYGNFNPVDTYAQHFNDAGSATPAAASGHPSFSTTSFPGYSSQPSAAPATSSGALEEIRTVYLSGFPPDVKERELNNLLRFLPGYEASQMHWKNNQAQGFALFATGASARAAKDAIHNLCFDDSTVLRCEMAHKNMYFKETEQASKRPKHAASQAYEPYSGSYPGYSYPSASVTPVQPAGYQQVTNTKDNPPCNTLFIGNLGDHVSEAELRALFSHQPGFNQLKMVRNSRNTTCFVEFVDVASAMMVHQTQQGAILQSSDRGGIRIQYSKNPFGKKRDSSAIQE
uniref:Cell wall integrity protein scw1 n=1 Tax=Tetraselmis sp. GSL018 TaxID=582737 RepID=A0A061RX97_9CHLO|mmetsp:Transcript_16012/g.37963  ORF Transcript_16012/g.37963 Transcript_16012/m.37963 type:complete len:290 (+) Transcript_16012:57-926(+)